MEGFVEGICVCEDESCDDERDTEEADEGGSPISDEPVVNSEGSAEEAAVGFIRIRQLRFLFEFFLDWIEIFAGYLLHYSWALRECASEAPRIRQREAL